MAHYVLNDTPKDGGDYILHSTECQFCPNEDNRTDIGDFDGCKDAMAKARQHHPNVNGCQTCCSECHG